jgi:hypothetical protein
MENISNILIKLSKRAEKVDPKILVDSFVNIGPLFTVLSTPDNQVLFGRRGTGKTHALIYLAESIKKNGDIPIYIDLRQIGSTGGIYADPKVPFSERATRLLIDTLVNIHDELLDAATQENSIIDLGKVGPVLDEMADAITEVTVSGPIEEERFLSDTQAMSEDVGIGITTSLKDATLGISAKTNQQKQGQSTYREKFVGSRIHRVNFGRVGDVFSKLIRAIGNLRIWIILDEWSVVPLDLQPYLADLIRRSLFPPSNITVKIGAIEKRSRFLQAGTETGDYIGIELGGDASADINMDDYMVFENDEERAVRFFRDMIFKHFHTFALEGEDSNVPSSADDLIRSAFTQENVFRELVRAAEGIPRDSFYILSIAAQKDYNQPISMDTIRKASKTWYQRDKEAAVSANQQALDLLHWIIDKVIAHRRARAFLIQRTVRNELIDNLFDARVLHLLKRNISAHDQPGLRYDVYKIDYGCYVDLLSTAKSPQGLFENDEGMFLQVPPDDYRAIRRAILDVEIFGKDMANKSVQRTS